MSSDDLKAFFEQPDDAVLASPDHARRHEQLLSALERGEVRAAEPEGGSWRVNAWVKRAILLGFRATPIEPMEGGVTPFFDKRGFPPRRLDLDDGVRVVPGGSAIRRGAYVAPGVVVMPPSYVNVGAYVGEGSMIDSHALVGSCAQVGSGVHLSAAAQIGGVLEPAGARPVIVEDEAFVGGLVGVFEGVRVGRRAVLASGVVLTASTSIVDLVHGRELRGDVPEGAVVVPGSRPARCDGPIRGVQLAAAVIVKYRDARTDAATALEEALR